MYPIKLKLQNFLSFAEQEYNFVQNSALLIQGVNNFKKESQESNGSGKSGLFCAMEYLYLQTTSRKCRDIKLIRRGCSEAIISCETYCPVRKESLFIERHIPRKGSTTLLISVNNEIKIDTANGNGTVSDGNSFIINWLGISKEDLSNFYLIHEDKYTSFFLSSNTKKIELISRFSNANRLSGINTLIEEETLKFDAQIRLKEDNLISLKTSLEIYQNDLVKEQSRDFEKEKKDKVQEINNLIAKIEEKITISNVNLKEKQRELNIELEKRSSIEASISSIQTSISSFTQDEKLSKDITEIKSKISEQEGTVKELNEIKSTFNKDLLSIDSNIKSLSVKLAGSVTCPNCSFEFLPSGKEDVKILKESKDSFTVKRDEVVINIQDTDFLISDINKTLKDYETILNSYKKKQSEQDTQLELLRKNLKKTQENLDSYESGIRNLKSSIANIESSIESSKLSIQTYKEQIDQVNKSVFLSKVNEIQENIQKTTLQIELLTKEKSEIEQEKMSIEEWIYNFKNFSSFLAQKSLLVLQTKINENLKSMKSDFRIKMEGFKQKADGTIKEEITPIIFDNGEEVEFGELSGGEKMRIDFAGILTVQDIINETHPYGGLKFLFTDEVGGKSDALGFKLLMKSAPKDRCILIITQLSQQICEETLTIVNNSGISSIM